MGSLKSQGPLYGYNRVPYIVTDTDSIALYLKI